MRVAARAAVTAAAPVALQAGALAAAQLLRRRDPAAVQLPPLSNLVPGPLFLTPTS